MSKNSEKMANSVDSDQISPGLHFAQTCPKT